MLRPSLLVVVAHLLALSACAAAGPGPAPAPPERPLQPLESEQEWAEYVAREREEGQRRMREAPPPEPPVIIESHQYYVPPPPPPRPGQAAPASMPPASLSVQPATEKDPGALAQVHGDFVIALHRGRLFTVRIGGDALEPVSVVDAFIPGNDGLSAEYDDMMVIGDRVVIVALQSEQVQLGVFHLAPDGQLTHRATYAMASAGRHFNERRMHVSRRVGDRLVFYSALSPHVYSRQASSFNDFPRITRAGDGVPARVAPDAPTRVHRPAAGNRGGSMHTVTSCALEGDDLRCRSVALYGPDARWVHFSETDAYLWTSERERYWDADAVPRHVLYRVPLDGSAPTALGVAGEPANAFAIHESGDGHLNVLVRRDASGAGVWGAERGLALLRIPLAQLGDGSRAAAAAQYRPLPWDAAGQLHLRFVNDWLVYGSGAFTVVPRPGPDSSTAYAVRVAGGEVARIPLPHSTDRIEPWGTGAVVLGAKGAELHVTTLRLDSAGAAAAAHHRVSGPAAGRALARGAFAGDAGGGVLALPMLEPDHRRPAPHATAGSAWIAVLRADGSRLEALGEVMAGDPDRDDGCLADCGAWFGNARPLIVDGRILALMGYELVEASAADGRLREVRRVSFTPRAPAETLAGDWEFTEELGGAAAPYRCRHAGTLRLDRAGQAITLRYRQTGECVINEVATSSDGEGRGTGFVDGNQLTFTVNSCSYRGRMLSPDAFMAYVSCPVPATPGSPRSTVEGSLQARRARP